MRTLPAAQQQVRGHLAEQPASDVVVILHQGVHRIAEPLRFTPADSPAEGHAVTWRAAEGAHVRISGGRVIDNWQRRDDGAFVARLDDVAGGAWSFRELFVGGERRPRARHPDSGYARVAAVGEDRRTNFTFHAGDVPAALDGDLTGTSLELVFFHDWSSSRTPVASVDPQERHLKTRVEVGPSLRFFHMDNWEPDPRYYLENHPALLDAPGEWYLDSATGDLTYLPKAGESIDTLEAVAPVAEGLVHARGEPGKPVRGLIFQGLHFEHAAPEQAATANVIEDNLIQRVGVQFFGAVGIWVGMAADTKIRHNKIRQTPYTGISVGWLWNPDPTPCRGTLIEANHIHDVMLVLSDGGGIYTLGWQPGAVFRENLIHGVPVNLGRAESNGMFIDEGSKGLLIEHNVIYDIDRSPLRFHRAQENDVHHNTLVLPDAKTSVFRFNATPEENIKAADNQIITADAFDPATAGALRERVGPTVTHDDVPDPADTFDGAALGPSHGLQRQGIVDVGGRGREPFSGKASSLWLLVGRKRLPIPLASFVQRHLH